MYSNSPIYYDKAVHGISHNPYKLLFVKYKGVPPFNKSNFSSVFIIRFFFVYELKTVKKKKCSKSIRLICLYKNQELQD